MVVWPEFTVTGEVFDKNQDTTHLVAVADIVVDVEELTPEEVVAERLGRVDEARVQRHYDVVASYDQPQVIPPGMQS